MRLQDVILRDTRAAQPAAASTPVGAIYYVTDENVTERNNGAAWEDISDAGSGAISDGATLAIGLTFPNTGLHILDTNASHDLILTPGSNITADRTLTITTGDADRTLTLTGNATLNQAVDTTADPAFNTLKLNDSNDSHTVQVLMGSDISADRTLTITTGDANRTLTLPVVGVVGITIDGGGSAITTGVKGYVECPFAGTIVSATIVADTAGAIVIDVWKDTFANFPPVDGDSITSATPPTITASNTNSQDTTLSSWITSVAAGDIFGFNVDSCTSITRATLTLKINRT